MKQQFQAVETNLNHRLSDKTTVDTKLTIIC
mgnify:FL=1